MESSQPRASAPPAAGANAAALVDLLPAGVRDLAPVAAYQVFTVQERLLGVMARHGYHRIMTPSFDAAESFDRAKDGSDPYADKGLFRFMDPESGQVVALRSDVTPQVARLVATQLGAAGAPYRFCYSANVYRPRAHFGIAPREILQAGAELLGRWGTAADVEVLGLAASCVAALDLEGWALTVGHGGILNALLAAAAPSVGPAGRAELADCCRRKDRAGLRGLLPAALNEAFDEALMGVGGPDVLTEARGPLGAVPGVAEALDELTATVEQAAVSLPGVHLVVDLASERGLDYYTGISFMGLLPGVGRPLLSGGRYDQLLGRYGVELPAIGFAVDEQAVLEGVARQGRESVLPPRDVLVVGDDPAATALTAELRAQDVPISVVRSIAPGGWRGLDLNALVGRMSDRGYKLVVFVEGETCTLVSGDGRRIVGGRRDVVASALAR